MQVPNQGPDIAANNIPDTPPADGWRDASVSIMKGIMAAFPRKNMGVGTFQPGGDLDTSSVDPSSPAFMDLITNNYLGYVVPVVVCVVCLVVCLLWFITHFVFLFIPLPCLKPLERYSKKEVFVPLVIFVVAGVGTLFASTAGLSGSSYVHFGVLKLLESTEGTFGDLIGFANGISNTLTAVVDRDLPGTRSFVVGLADEKTSEISPNISRAIDPLVGNITAALADLDTTMTNVTNMVLGMKLGTNNVSVGLNMTRLELGHLDLLIQNVTYRNVSGEQYKIGGLPDVSTYASDLPNVTSTPDFDDILNRLSNTPDPKNVTRDINETLSDFLTDVNAQTANISRDIDKQFEDVTKSLNSSISGVTDILSGMAKQADGIKTTATSRNSEILTYEDYRIAAMTTMWTVILATIAAAAIAILLKMGIVFVIIATVLLFMTIPLHIQGLVYAPLSMISEDICIQTKSFKSIMTDLGGGAGGNQTGDIVDIYDKCSNGAGLTEAFNIGDRFNADSLSFNFNASDSFNISDSFNFGSQVDDINNQNLSSINFTFSNFTTKAGFNLSETLIELESARSNISLATFNFSTSDIDVAFNSLNSVLVPCCSIMYTPSNFTYFNISTFDGNPQNVSIRIRAEAVQKTLDKNQSVYDTIDELNRSIDGIKQHIIFMSVDLVDPLERTLALLKLNETTAKYNHGTLVGEVEVLTNATNDLQEGIPPMQSSVIANVDNLLVAPAQAAVKGLVDTVTDFDSYGSCLFLGTRTKALFSSFCEYLEPGSYMIWSSLFWGGIFMMFFLVPMASTAQSRVKDLWDFRPDGEDPVKAERTALCGTTVQHSRKKDDDEVIDLENTAPSKRNRRKANKTAPKEKKPSAPPADMEKGEKKQSLQDSASKRRRKIATKKEKTGKWSKKYDGGSSDDE
eukprot:TRINITY_DN2145_c1_g1_i15.p1 TRINITY_DN2145_c1_g1~~TRINITY_DN2145_c1_g1_i15.p1  ORF type:complete len:912 (-),score=267.87 TRINITY_DN2145_c1_g1_i15:20-2755(-)